MIVEDEPTIASAMADALAEADCDVTLAASAGMALTRLATESHHLLVLDLNLPDRIHPNARGHAVIAETVWKALRPLL